MRHSLLAAALLSATLAACQGQAPTTPAAGTAATAASTQQADAKFDALSKRWLDEWMRLNPVSATQIGDHRYDATIDDYSAAGRQTQLAFNQKLTAELDALDQQALSREKQVDLLLLKNQVRGDIFALETLQSWAWDPQLYNSLAGGALYNLMARDFAPMPERLKNATARMEKLPALFAQMRENLDPARVPKIHAETVSKQNAGVVGLVDQFIVPAADQLQGEDRKRLDAAIAALR